MNAKELRTIQEAAKRFMPESSVTRVEEAVKVELPYASLDGKSLYFFVVKRNKTKRFSMLLPVESAGITASNDTLVLLQKLLKTYELILTQEAVILEENINIPLHKRLAVMARVVIGIDAIRRLWTVEFDRRTNAVKSESVEPPSN